MQARALVLSTLCFLPGRLHGQEVASPQPFDSLAFHRGQWAVQFGGGLNLFSLGALRFTGEKTAWLLDFDVAATIVNGERTDNLGGGTADSKDHFAAASVRVGKRFYGSRRGKVFPFHSLALEGGYQDRKVEFAPGIRQVINQWYAGLYWEVGAAYRIAPALSVGGTGSISGGYVRRKSEDPNSTFKGGGFYVNGPQVLFAVGIYF
jgi:hypothetical protein